MFEYPDTLQRLSQPMVKVDTNEEATVHVYDLDLFVTAQLLVDTLAVLLLGKICEDHG